MSASTLIIGLGNPGAVYAYTRHNAGFLCIDHLAQVWQCPRWESKKKFLSEITEYQDMVLAKPQTFMNDSGRAAAALRQWYKPKQLYVIHDDLDLALGKSKLQWAKGPKIHNGLLSLYQELGTHEFWHLRLGVDGRKPEDRLPGHAYVLSDFPLDEQALFATEVETAVDELQTHLKTKHA